MYSIFAALSGFCFFFGLRIGGFAMVGCLRLSHRAERTLGRCPACGAI
jgi:hypothetical protein